MAATIIIPTRGRPDYLEVTLDSVAPQAAEAGAELLIVDDSADAATVRVAARHDVTAISTGGARGANGARNAGVAATAGDPVVFIDDDVRAPDGWLQALLDGIAAAPDIDVFGGPITAVIEGGPRSCGREGAPITTLDHGPADRDVELVWSANMAIRRRALERVGPFDETIRGRGEEEDWERRYAALGGRIRYLAAAGLEHRRAGADARLAALDAQRLRARAHRPPLRHAQGLRADAASRAARARRLRGPCRPPALPEHDRRRRPGRRTRA